jgi:hypothetical protein
MIDDEKIMTIRYRICMDKVDKGKREDEAEG